MLLWTVQLATLVPPTFSWLLRALQSKRRAGTELPRLIQLYSKTTGTALQMLLYNKTGTGYQEQTLPLSHNNNKTLSYPRPTAKAPTLLSRLVDLLCRKLMFNPLPSNRHLVPQPHFQTRHPPHLHSPTYHQPHLLTHRPLHKHLVKARQLKVHSHLLHNPPPAPIPLLLNLPHLPNLPPTPILHPPNHPPTPTPRLHNLLPTLSLP